MKLQFIKKIALAITCLGLGLSSLVNVTTNVYAYDYNLNTDGDWEVEDNSPTNQYGYLYLLVENDNNYKYTKTRYTFGCYNEDLPEEYDGYIKGVKEMLLADREPLESTPYGDIYEIRFGLVPGKYCFSYPDGTGNENFEILLRDYSSPRVGAGYYTKDDALYGNYEIITIAEGQSIKLYGLCGSEEWKKNELENFTIYEYMADWSKNHDALYREDTDVTDGDKDESNSGDTNNLSGNPGETVTKTQRDFKPTEGDLRTVTKETATIDPNANQPKTEEKSGPGLKVYIGAGVFVLILVGIILWKKKQADEAYYHFPDDDEDDTDEDDLIDEEEDSDEDDEDDE